MLSLFAQLARVLLTVVDVITAADQPFRLPIRDQCRTIFGHDRESTSHFENALCVFLQ
jgi:hypothetical protein